jgi:membrane-associated phospholipid phosphatase
MKSARFLLFTMLLMMNSGLRATEQFERYGDYLQILLPVTAMTAAFLEEDEKMEAVWQFGKSFSTTIATTHLLKHLVQKPRPVGDNLSFPSGHTAASFAGASFIQKRYGWKYGIPAYVAASYVGWSRVAAEQHYSEDVIAAAALAIYVNEYFVTPWQKGLSVSLIPASSAVALQVNARW